MQNIRQLNEADNISPYDYYKSYIRNSRLFGLIWFFVTICFTLALILVFIQPNWVGDTEESPNRGYFGLSRFCIRLKYEYYCYGTWKNFSTFKTAAFKAACVFIGISILISFICIVLYLLSIIIKFERIFHICAWLQFFCTILIFIALTIYPAGWNSDFVRNLCGAETDQYKLGTCELKWPYIVACILLFNILFLCIFAFLLAARQAKFILLYTDDGKYVYSNRAPNIQMGNFF